MSSFGKQSTSRSKTHNLIFESDSSLNVKVAHRSCEWSTKRWSK